MAILSRHGLKCIKARASSSHDFVPTRPAESATAAPSPPAFHTLAGPGSRATGINRLTPRSNGNDLTSMIAGSILGVLCFIGITTLIVRLLLRRRQRMYGDVKSISSNGKLSRMSRNSMATLTSWYPRHQSTTSFRTGASTPSQVLGQSQGQGQGHMRNTSEPLATPRAVFFNNPFSKSAELCAAPPVDRRDPTVPGDLYLDPEATAKHQQYQPRNHAKQPSLSNDLQTIQEKPEEYPRKPERLFIPRSLYSNDCSIGSTIVLPGRNSSVGSLQVLSYRLSSPFRLSHTSRMHSPGVLLTPRMPVDSRRRSSTRSDPFDLEDGASATDLHEQHPLPQYPLHELPLHEHPGPQQHPVPQQPQPQQQQQPCKTAYDSGSICP